MGVVAPAEWKGSDLRSRAEIVRYLDRRGGKVTDESGLVVTQMRNDLHRGRSLSQLLQEMEADGMIRREVRGRRTFAVELLDDWGLIARGGLGGVPIELPEPVTTRSAPEQLDAETDYDQLAAALLAIVVKRASEPVGPPTPDPALVRRLQQAESQLEEARRQADEAARELAAARASSEIMAEQKAQLQANVDTLQAALEGMPGDRRRSLEARLSPEERATLAALQGQLDGGTKTRTRRNR